MSIPRLDSITNRIFPITNIDDVPEHIRGYYIGYDSGRLEYIYPGYLEMANYNMPVTRQMREFAHIPDGDNIIEHSNVDEYIKSLNLSRKMAFLTPTSREYKWPSTVAAYRMYIAEYITKDDAKLSDRFIFPLSYFDGLDVSLGYDISMVRPGSTWHIRTPNRGAGGLNDSSTARKLFHEFSGGLLDGFNLSGDEFKAYITGSAIEYCCARHDPKVVASEYSNSDIDILVVGNLELAVARIVEHLSSNHQPIVEWVTKNKAHISVPGARLLEVYSAQLGSPVMHHVPMVRGWFDGHEFHLTISAVLSIAAGTFSEYRRLGIGSCQSFDIIAKYIRRGWTFIGSAYECQILEDIMDRELEVVKH